MQALFFGVVSWLGKAFFCLPLLKHDGHCVTPSSNTKSTTLHFALGMVCFNISTIVAFDLEYNRRILNMGRNQTNENANAMRPKITKRPGSDYIRDRVQVAYSPVKSNRVTVSV